MNILELMKKKYGSPQDDVIPYDPDKGTLMNIGRFIANNAVTDPGIAGAIPMLGSLKVLSRFPKIEGIIESGRMVPDAAETLSTRGLVNSNLAKLAEKGALTQDDLLRQSQKLQRAVYQQDVNQAPMLERLRKIAEQQ